MAENLSPTVCPLISNRRTCWAWLSTRTCFQTVMEDGFKLHQPPCCLTAGACRTVCVVLAPSQWKVGSSPMTAVRSRKPQFGPNDLTMTDMNRKVINDENDWLTDIVQLQYGGRGVQSTRCRPVVAIFLSPNEWMLLMWQSKQRHCSWIRLLSLFALAHNLGCYHQLRGSRNKKSAILVTFSATLLWNLAFTHRWLWQ